MAPWREGGAGKGCHNFICNDEQQGVEYGSETEQSLMGDLGGAVQDENGLDNAFDMTDVESDSDSV